MSEYNRHRAYYAACQADNAYQCELVRVYGKEACNARYREAHTDPYVQAAMLAKLDADRAFLTTWGGKES